jgi:hypothetical protein
MVWLINGLHNRPDDHFASRDLMRAILPHTDDVDRGDLAIPEEDENEEDEEMEETRPHNPCGMVFLRALVLPPRSVVPRLRVGRSASDYTFKILLQMSAKEIAQLLSPPGILHHRDIPATRIPTVKRTTASYVSAQEHDEPLFTLGQAGYRLPSPVRDDGSDMDDDDIFEDQHPQNLDQKLTTIWYQFLLDIMAKRPNPKGVMNPSYCIIEDCSQVKADFYQNRKLSDVWRCCQYRLAGADLWSSAFSHLWPPKGHVLQPLAQNYKTCRYYTSWKRLISDLDARTVKEVRKAMKAKFDTLYWIPAATAGKMWNTKPEKDFVSFPVGWSSASPRLFVQGGHGQPQW